MRPRVQRAIAVLTLALAPGASAFQVRQYEGRRMIDGVQLLQDAGDPLAYYYLPQAPRLATREDGTFEFLCLKYVDPDGQANGGIFHALVRFDLPEERVQELERMLRTELPRARVLGPVPLQAATEQEAGGVGSFRLVSAVLSDVGQGGFTRSVVSSGQAPLLPGSKAVIAASLNQAGATLLWDSLTAGSTSDVSVAVRGYYEARVEGYRAVVSAEMDSIYEHMSRVENDQSAYSRRQVRDVVDRLQQAGVLRIDVTEGSGDRLDNEVMDRVLELVTDKLADLMFDAETGWATQPERAQAVEEGQIPGRRKRGWFSRTFGGTQDSKYISDHQYVLKRRQDVRRHRFYLDLSRTGTVLIPVDTAGNLSGLYEDLRDDPRYFRVVNLGDPAFDRREVRFQLDGGYVEAFTDLINHVSIQARKTYPDQPALVDTLHLSYEDVQAGTTGRVFSFPRLGQLGSDWSRYEYRVVWGLRGGEGVSDPVATGAWHQAERGMVVLAPPFEKRRVEVEVPLDSMAERGFDSLHVQFFRILSGKPCAAGSLHFGAQSLRDISLYCDPGQPVGYGCTWNRPEGPVKGEVQLLEDDFIFLVPPSEPGRDEGGER